MNLWWYLSCRVTTSLIFLKMVSFWLRMFMGTWRLDSIWFNWWEMNVFISLTNSSSPLMSPLTSWLGRHSDMTDKLLVLCICVCKCIMTNWADYLTLFKTLKISTWHINIPQNFPVLFDCWTNSIKTILRCSYLRERLLLELSIY